MNGKAIADRCRHQDDCAERRSCESRRCAPTLAARAVQLLNTDPPPRTAPPDPRIAHVPPKVDIEVAARKLLATAARQGMTLTITNRAKRGAPGHYETIVTVRPVEVGR